MHLVAKGISNQEIARRLVISEATVRTHIDNVLNKLHLANRVQAALYALRKGVSTLDQGRDTGRIMSFCLAMADKKQILILEELGVPRATFEEIAAKAGLSFNIVWENPTKADSS